MDQSSHFLRNTNYRIPKICVCCGDMPADHKIKLGGISKDGSSDSRRYLTNLEFYMCKRCLKLRRRTHIYSILLFVSLLVLFFSFYFFRFLGDKILESESNPVWFICGLPVLVSVMYIVLLEKNWKKIITIGLSQEEVELQQFAIKPVEISPGPFGISLFFYNPHYGRYFASLNSDKMNF